MTQHKQNRNLGEKVQPEELDEIWKLLSTQERLEGLRELTRGEGKHFFVGLSASDKAQLLMDCAPPTRRAWFQLLPPDDAADVIQEFPQKDREKLLSLLSEPARVEVAALLAYAEDVAGGLMNPRYARVRPEMTMIEAISYLRKQAREHMDSISYIYVLDGEQKLLGVVNFRDLFIAPNDSKIIDIMNPNVITIPENMDQEAISQVFKESKLMAVPVIDDQNHIKGVIAINDIVDVVQEEATEDIQKLGATEVLDAPYLKVSLRQMIRKRASWLSALFLGEMLTATAMGFFENQIAQAVVLALFIPLIISSGGNSGSQASTLVIRAMALGEVRLRDWFRVVGREIVSGFALGTILGSIGFLRIVFWPQRVAYYGEHYLMVAAVVSLSLVGVVMFGTLCGAMLPFFLRRVGFDPASASAPFVATLVDLTGLVIYFSLAKIILHGVLL